MLPGIRAPPRGPPESRLGVAILGAGERGVVSALGSAEVGTRGVPCRRICDGRGRLCESGADGDRRWVASRIVMQPSSVPEDQPSQTQALGEDSVGQSSRPARSSGRSWTAPVVQDRRRGRPRRVSVDPIHLRPRGLAHDFPAGQACARRVTASRPRRADAPSGARAAGRRGRSEMGPPSTTELREKERGRASLRDRTSCPAPGRTVGLPSGVWGYHLLYHPRYSPSGRMR